MNYFKRYKEFSDSLLLDEKSKLVEIQRFDFKKILEDKESIIQIEKEKARLDTQKNRLTIFLLLLGLLGVSFFLFMFYRQNRKRKKINNILRTQKAKIDEKHAELSEKNDEINESITYAERIQQSTLPEIKVLNQNFEENYVFYKPRDVVSGDFYWWAKMEDEFVFAAADCTGHGVPGAFMSILGMSVLKEIVIKEYITHPGVILRKMRKEVINSLKQKGESGEQKDGMDMALISINPQDLTIKFSGAQNPLIIISDTEPECIESHNKHKVFESPDSNLKLFEYKGDNMPIGIYPKMDRFGTLELKLKKGDQVILYSDGFQDQFGGEKGKKFMAGKFKKLLLEIATKPLPEQHSLLDKKLQEWMGSQPQVDDITIISLKV